MIRLVTSAAYRIAIVYSVAFSFTIVALGVAVYLVADADIREQHDATIATESADLVREYVQDGPGALRDAIRAREAGNATNAFGYALFGRDGRRIAGALDIPRPPAGRHNILVNDPVEGPDPTRIQAADLAGGLRLVVASDTEAVEAIDQTILMLCTAAIGFAVITGTLGAYLLGRYLRRRLERISGTAQAIVLGDLERRVPISGQGDEFDDLGRALNAMLDRIALLLDNLRQVSSDVAHDLRTPLSRLRGELEIALDGGLDPPAHRQSLKRALRQSDDMLKLFGAILRISEVEGGALAASFTTVDVSALVQDLCDSYAPAVLDGGRTLTCDVEPGIRVRGERELIAQALINLLDNAQNHTPPGTAITVGADGAQGWSRISVADTGPGVAPEDRARIVQRFVRLEASRTTPGHGLGLNLVSAIATAHGGAVIIGDNRPGLLVTITLPTLA
jgi:signal transduction histidine kinase